MFYTYHIKCPKCGTAFDWHDGKVGDKVYLHCDVCGKELLYPEDKESFIPDYPICECGGSFSVAEYWVPFICPNCDYEIEKHEIRETVEVTQSEEKIA